jgi:hypothetical protein
MRKRWITLQDLTTDNDVRKEKIGNVLVELGFFCTEMCQVQVKIMASIHHYEPSLIFFQLMKVKSTAKIKSFYSLRNSMTNNKKKI